MLSWLRRLICKPKKVETEIDWTGARRQLQERAMSVKRTHKKHTHLTPEEKDEIKSYYDNNPDLDKHALAQMYDVSYSTVCRIIKGYR